MKINTEDNLIKKLDEDIILIKKELNEVETNRNPYITWMGDEDKIKKLQHNLDLKNTRRQQILDHREGFYNKLFWNLIVPILVSVITTLLINYYIFK